MQLWYTTSVLVWIYTMQSQALPLDGISNSDAGQTHEADSIEDPHEIAAMKNKQNTALTDGINHKPEVHNRNVPIIPESHRMRRHEHQSHANHTMQHILDQIHKGHVTSASMSHWMAQLESMYNDGQITSDDLRTFIDQMHASLDSTEYEGACCPFGK